MDIYGSATNNGVTGILVQDKNSLFHAKDRVSIEPSAVIRRMVIMVCRSKRRVRLCLMEPCLSK